MKEAFDLLIKKIVGRNPKAGTEKGSGSVFGAGLVDKSEFDAEPRRSGGASKKSTRREERGPAKSSTSENGRPSAGTNSDSKRDEKKKGKCILL